VCFVNGSMRFVLNEKPCLKSLKQKDKPIFISLFIDCKSPAPNNGTADSPKGTTYGEVAIVSCNEGYTRSGSAFITCLANGTWSEKPTCNIVGKTCPKIIFIEFLEDQNYMWCHD
jgi:Sushi repeat (SCR repeat)